MKDKIISFLPDRYKSLPVHFYETTDSTNRVAKELAAKGDSLPVLVVADSQSAGRGRLGRSFYSPSDTGIYMSLTVGGFDDASDALFITSATAVCVTDAIISLTGKTAGIKWVNDICLDGKKICGILAESQILKSGIAVTIGIGINVTTVKFPQDISDVAGALNTNVPREMLIAEITKNLLDMLESPDKHGLITKYKERSVLLGKEITFLFNGEKKSATAIDIDDAGGLVVKTPCGEIVTLSSGEITVRLK